MRGTLTVVVALSLIALTVVPSTASADFHPVCDPPAAAYANVELHASPDGSNLTYSGGVYCPSAEVTIEALTLVRDAAYGPPSEIGNLTAGPCSSSLTEPCTVSGDAPGSGGTYTVTMVFDVDDPSEEGIEFDNVTRQGVFEYTGHGQPVPVCVSAGALPILVGVC